MTFTAAGYAEDLYVEADGLGDCSYGDPCSLSKVQKVSQLGDTIHLLSSGGPYIGKSITLRDGQSLVGDDLSGTPGDPLPGGSPQTIMRSIVVDDTVLPKIVVPETFVVTANNNTIERIQFEDAGLRNVSGPKSGKSKLKKLTLRDLVSINHNASLTSREPIFAFWSSGVFPPAAFRVILESGPGVEINIENIDISEGAGSGLSLLGPSAEGVVNVDHFKTRNIYESPATSSKAPVKGGPLYGASIVYLLQGHSDMTMNLNRLDLKNDPAPDGLDRFGQQLKIETYDSSKLVTNITESVVRGAAPQALFFSAAGSSKMDVSITDSVLSNISADPRDSSYRGAADVLDESDGTMTVSMHNNCIFNNRQDAETPPRQLRFTTSSRIPMSVDISDNWWGPENWWMNPDDAGITPVVPILIGSSDEAPNYPHILIRGASPEVILTNSPPGGLLFPPASMPSDLQALCQ